LCCLILIAGCDSDEETAGNYPKPAITRIEPAMGLVGTEVTITGTGLKNVTRVDFGSVSAANFSPENNSDNTIVVQVPEGLTAGEIQVAVYYAATSEQNLGASDNKPFVVLSPPQLTSTIPLQAKPGYEIKLFGRYLEETTRVAFGDVSVDFVAGAQEITTTVPDIAAGDVEVTVTTPGGTATIPFIVIARIPEVYSFDIPQVEPGETVTVVGRYFENVQSVMIGSTTVTDYTVVSPTELTLVVPATATTGKIKVTNGFGFGESANTIGVVQNYYILYNEGFTDNWQNWSWGGAVDPNNTEQAFEGTTAMKKAYDGSWDAIQLGNMNSSTVGYSKLIVSIYGAAGTEGKKIKFFVNGSGTFKQLTVEEGEWVTYEATWAELGNPASVSTVALQAEGWAGTIYADKIAFKK
jgi:hypothetical protein